MSGPREPDEFLDLAEPYALHALDEGERDRVEAALGAAAPDTAAAFESRVQDVRETMAAYADGYHERPSPATFDRILGGLVSGPGVTPLRAPDRRRGQRMLRIGAAAAAVLVAVALGVVGARVLDSDGPAPGSPDADTVLAAPDARTAQARVGDATISFIYSRERNTGVVLMNDVPPPQDGTVYQMWLMDPGGGARSRGTMAQGDVRPTTTAAVAAIDGATSFGISIEAPGGANTPSPDRIVATLPIAPS